MCRHMLLYLIISCLSLCRCYIHIIKFNRYIYIIVRLLFQLGQKNYRLHMRVILRHIPTNQQKKYNYLYNMNSSNQ